MAGVRSLPTFQIYRRGTKVAEQIGANPKLEQWLLEHDNAMPTSFTGSGRTLGGEPGPHLLPCCALWRKHVHFCWAIISVCLRLGSSHC